MANAPTDHRPLLDPHHMEEAGRTLRRMLERLKAPRQAQKSVPDDIAWEDGEPNEDERSRYG
jgi:hypothetical protein